MRANDTVSSITKTHFPGLLWLHSLLFDAILFPIYNPFCVYMRINKHKGKLRGETARKKETEAYRGTGITLDVILIGVG